NIGSSVDAAHTRVKQVAQSVAQKVKGKHSDHDCRARKQRFPGRELDKLASAAQHAAPRRVRRLNAQAKKAQTAFGEDGGREGHGDQHDERNNNVGKDVLENHVEMCPADCARGEHKVAVDEFK